MDFFQGIKKVRARYNFAGTGDDELAFSKGDIITVTQMVDGGWWEGFIGDGESFGWYPSNYVKDTSGPGSPSKSAKKDTENVNANLENKYQDEVLRNILETEKEYCTEMTTLINNHLKPLQTSGVLPTSDEGTLLCNLVELLRFHENFCRNLEEVSNLAGRLRKVGVCYMKASTEYKLIYSAYCSNHPKTAAVLTKYLDELSRYMESNGSDIMVLTTGLYKPFRLTEKYPNDLMELERHTPVEHPDRINITTAISVFKDICKHCQFVRKQKEIELDIMTGTVQGWEGEPINTLGDIIKMIQASHQESGSRNELLLLIFASQIVVLNPTKSMSGYIYQNKFPIDKVQANSLPDTETQLGAFEFSGPGMEKTTISCGSLMDREDFVEAIHHAQNSATGIKIPKVSKALVPAPLHITQVTKQETSTNALSPRLVPADNSNKSASLPSPKTPKPPLPTKPHSLTPPSSPALLASVGFRPSAPINPISVWSMKPGDVRSAPGKKKERSTKRRGKEEKTKMDSTPFLRTERQGDDNLILQVIEAYCFSNTKRNTIIPNARPLSSANPPDSGPHVFLAEEEKIIVEETKGNQTVVEEKSLIDTVYALRDQVNSLMGETKTLKKDLDLERKARRKLESSVRKSMKSMDFKVTIPDL